MLSAGRSDPQGATVAVRPAPTGEVASSSPHVVIAIVGYRDPDDIRGCLKALSRSRHSNFSIEICENGGVAAYEALIAAMGDIAILDICLAEVADGPKWDAIWILNPDTEPDPDALAALVAKSREKDYAIIGSRLLVKRTGRVQLYGGRWRPWIARGFNIGFNAPSESTPDVAAVEREMTYVNGAAMFVPRAFIERVGPMDERYFLYCDEIDWCWRRGSAPLGYAHDSIVLHAHGSTIGSSHSRQDRSALSVYLEERNKLLFTRRFYPVLYPLVVVSTLLLTGQYLAEGAHANFRVALAGWRAGIRGETGMPGWFGRS